MLLLVSSSDSYTVGGLLSASTSSLSIELEGREGGERERGREEGREEGEKKGGGEGGREREREWKKKGRQGGGNQEREGEREKKRERVREGECTRSCRLSQVETVCGEEPFEQKINL